MIVKDSLEECSDLLMSLTSVSGDAQGPEAWPYIKKIRSDEGVKKVFDLARQARLSNVSIICTKSDDIRADEALRDWGGAEASRIQRRIDNLATAEEESSTIRDRLDELRELGDEIEDDEKFEKECLYEELDQLKLQRHLITTRNALVQSELHHLYRNDIQGGDLHVFCASNVLYWENRHLRSRDRAIRFLELSGIIAIRRHCMALVSESQLRLATAYVRDDIPKLLSSIELWVDSGAGTADAEKKQAVREALDGFGDSLRTSAEFASGQRVPFELVRFGRVGITGMEASYSSANRESGGGSWGRKKSIINGALRNEQLFTEVMSKFKNKFEDLATQLETDAWALVQDHLRGIEGTLDMVRSENIALESERDPAFRARVADEVRSAVQAIERIRVTVGTA
ncbi:hypothetical protein NEMBOFW57_009059 [Staphylotrichum longicolle]|uniref:DUF7605 domain-containing protein n=1 Tax=Staphylotrichum longicolle TaxID=669026 RepID=A0AAD4ET76_9PEZI|nr:hypothetical protein NEMBOFW57_009059 [Staphylotrichum longicolle]